MENNGKDVKSNQTSSQKGKSYFIELYKNLDAQLNSAGELSDRVQHLCSAWQRVHTLCAHSAPTTHPHLIAWIQRHTAIVILRTEWQSPKSKDVHKQLEEAIDSFVAECEPSEDAQTAWEKQLIARAQWLRAAISNPWGHPVLRLLLDPRGQPPSNDEILGWLKEERGLVFAARLRQLALEKCDDLALTLLTVVMDRVRLCRPPVNDFALEEAATPQAQGSEPTFESILSKEAGFADSWDLLTDMELVLLHKSERNSRLIDLAKTTPLVNGYQLVERLINRLNANPKEKKIWKNAKDVATLVSQVMITRCMVIPSCAGVVRTILYWCSRALVKVLPASKLGKATLVLAAPAGTARHLHTLATAVHAQQSAESTELKPFVVELYVRAITFGMNELEKLKMQPEYEEKEARSTEQTLAGWFVQLGQLLSGSARVRCECALTAFSLHPSPQLYERIRHAPPLPPVQLDTSPKEEEDTETTKNCWANDSHSQTNFVKTSETLNLKLTQHQANVLSTAILNEGEALGLNPELCQDIIVLLSGPRVKTLSWDMDRELLLENCRTYMERTQYGTRALTTELKYLNLDLSRYQHLPEEEENEDDIYYGIEKGYEHHLVEVDPQPEEIWEDAFYAEETDSAVDDDEDDIPKRRKKKKNKHLQYTSESESDPLCLVAEQKRTEKKERPHSKERSKEKEKYESKEFEKHKHDKAKHGKKKEKQERKKEKKETKERKKREKKESHLSITHSNVIGMKLASAIPQTITTNVMTDSDYDSQGKSSLQSEGNEDSVLYDGQFSMDELKSPEKKSPVLHKNLNKELDIARNKLCQVLNFPNPMNKAPYISETKTPSSTTTSFKTVTPESSKNNTLTLPMQKDEQIREEVKKSITKLIQFRRTKPDTSKPKSEDIKTLGHQSSNSLALSRLVGTRLEYPRLHTKLPEQPNVKKKEPKIYSKAIFYRPASPRPTSCSRTQPYVTPKLKKAVSLCDQTLSNNSVSTSSQPVLNNALDLSSQSQVQNPETSEQSPQPSPQKSSVTHLNSYQQFLQQWQNCENSPNEKKVKPKSKATRVTETDQVPTITNLTTGKKEPVSPQCAKTTPQKKVENVSSALNTFSRLHYLHKNKHFEKYKTEPSAIWQQSVSAELDRRIAELKAKAEQASKSEENPKVEVQFIEQPLNTTNIDRGHPILSNMLKNDSKAMVKKTTNMASENTELRINAAIKNTSLTEKDQQEILKLLGQQNLMNAYKSAVKSKIENLDSKIVNTQILNIPQTRVLNLPQTQISTTPQTQMSAMPQTRVLNMPQTQRSNMPHTQILTMPQPQISTMPQPQMSTTPQTQMSNMLQTQRSNMPQTQRSNMPQTQMSTMPQTQMSTMPQTQVLNMSQPQRSNMPLSQTSTMQTQVLNIPHTNNNFSQNKCILASSKQGQNNKYALGQGVNQPQMTNFVTVSGSSSPMDINISQYTLTPSPKSTESKFNPSILSQYNELKVTSTTTLNQQLALKGIDIRAKVPVKMEGQGFQFPIISNTTILKTTAMVQNKVIPVQPTQPKPKAKGKAGQKGKRFIITTNSEPDIEVNKTVSKKYVPKPPLPAPKPTEDLEEQNWTKVLDALRSHKTPSRGPHALDIIMNKDSIETKEDSKQSIDTPTSQPTKPPTSEKVELFVSNILREQAMQSKSSPSILRPTPPPKSRGAVPKVIQLKKPNAPKKSSSTEIKMPNPVQIMSGVANQSCHTKILKKDPFISGIPHSDYEILEELMDDDLRQEIGELSSDEDNYGAAASPAKVQPEVKSVDNGIKSNASAQAKPKISMDPGFIIRNKASHINPQSTTKSPNIQNDKPRILSNEKVDICNLPENIVKSVIRQVPKNTANTKPLEGTTKTINNIHLKPQVNEINATQEIKTVSSQKPGQNMVIYDPFGVSTSNQNFVHVDNTSKLIYQPYKPTVSNQLIISSTIPVNNQPTLVNIKYSTPIVPVVVPTMAITNVIIQEPTCIVNQQNITPKINPVEPQDKPSPIIKSPENIWVDTSVKEAQKTPIRSSSTTIDINYPNKFTTKVINEVQEKLNSNPMPNKSTNITESKEQLKPKPITANLHVNALQNLTRNVKNKEKEKSQPVLNLNENLIEVKEMLQPQPNAINIDVNHLQDLKKKVISEAQEKLKSNAAHNDLRNINEAKQKPNPVLTNADVIANSTKKVVIEAQENMKSIVIPQLTDNITGTKEKAKLVTILKSSEKTTEPELIMKPVVTPKQLLPQENPKIVATASLEKPKFFVKANPLDKSTQVSTTVEVPLETENNKLPCIMKNRGTMKNHLNIDPVISASNTSMKVQKTVNKHTNNSSKELAKVTLDSPKCGDESCKSNKESIEERLGLTGLKKKLEELEANKHLKTCAGAKTAKKLSRKAKVKLKNSVSEIKKSVMADELPMMETKSIAQIAMEKAIGIVSDENKSRILISEVCDKTKNESATIKMNIIPNKDIKASEPKDSPLPTRTSERIQKMKKSQNKETIQLAVPETILTQTPKPNTEICTPIVTASESNNFVEEFAAFIASAENVDKDGNPILEIKTKKSENYMVTTTIKDTETATKEKSDFKPDKNLRKKNKKPLAELNIDKPLLHEEFANKVETTDVVPRGIEILSSPEIEISKPNLLLKHVANKSSENTITSNQNNGAGRNLDENLALQHLNDRHKEALAIAGMTKPDQSALPKNAVAEATPMDKSQTDLVTLSSDSPKVGVSIEQKFLSNKKLTKLVDDIESALSVITETTIRSPLAETTFETEQTVTGQGPDNETNISSQESKYNTVEIMQFDKNVTNSANSEQKTYISGSLIVKKNAEIKKQPQISQNDTAAKIVQCEKVTTSLKSKHKENTKNTPTPIIVRASSDLPKRKNPIVMQNQEQVKNKESISINNDPEKESTNPYIMENDIAEKQIIPVNTQSRETNDQVAFKKSIVSDLANKDAISLSDDSEIESLKSSVVTASKEPASVKALDKLMKKPTSPGELDNKANDIKDTISISDDSDMESTTATVVKNDKVIPHKKPSNKKQEKPKETVEISQAFKDSIIIAEIPIPGNTDPLKKCVRIVLPNKKAILATVYGKVNVSFDTLFQEPSFKEILNLSSLNENKRYTVNIQHVYGANNELFDAKISNITVKDSKHPKKVKETVNLVSDDEEDRPTQKLKTESQDHSTQTFTTESGSFKIKSISENIFKKHQDKFSLKCGIRLRRCDYKPKTDTLVEALLKDLIPAIEPNQVIELDDSSEEEIAEVASVDILKEKLLMKQFNVADILESTCIVTKDTRLSRARNSNYNRDSSAKSTSVETENRLTSSAKRPKNKKEESNDLYISDFSNIIKRKCYVKLIKCDHLVKNNDDEESDDDVIACDDLEENAILSRSGSFSLLNDIGLHEPLLELENLPKNYTDRNSPVMEIFDMIVGLHEVSKSKNSDSLGADLCSSEWFNTKQFLHSENVLEKSGNGDLKENSFDENDITRDCETDVSDLDTSFSDSENHIDVPSLKSIMAKFFNNLIKVMEPMSIEITHDVPKSPTKRKSTTEDDNNIIKVNKMSVEPILDTPKNTISYTSYSNILHSELNIKTPLSLFDISVKYLLSQLAYGSCNSTPKPFSNLFESATMNKNVTLKKENRKLLNVVNEHFKESTVMHPITFNDEPISPSLAEFQPEFDILKPIKMQVDVPKSTSTIFDKTNDTVCTEKNSTGSHIAVTALFNSDSNHSDSSGTTDHSISILDTQTTTMDTSVTDMHPNSPENYISEIFTNIQSTDDKSEINLSVKSPNDKPRINTKEPTPVNFDSDFNIAKMQLQTKNENILEIPVQDASSLGLETSSKENPHMNSKIDTLKEFDTDKFVHYDVKESTNSPGKEQGTLGDTTLTIQEMIKSLHEKGVSEDTQPIKITDKIFTHQPCSTIKEWSKLGKFPQESLLAIEKADTIERAEQEQFDIIEPEVVDTATLAKEFEELNEQIIRTTNAPNNFSCKDFRETEMLYQHTSNNQVLEEMGKSYYDEQTSKEALNITHEMNLVEDIIELTDSCQFEANTDIVQTSDVSLSTGTVADEFVPIVKETNTLKHTINENKTRSTLETNIKESKPSILEKATNDISHIEFIVHESGKEIAEELTVQVEQNLQYLNSSNEKIVSENMSVNYEMDLADIIKPEEASKVAVSNSEIVQISDVSWSTVNASDKTVPLLEPTKSLKQTLLDIHKKEMPAASKTDKIERKSLILIGNTSLMKPITNKQDREMKSENLAAVVRKWQSMNYSDDKVKSEHITHKTDLEKVTIKPAESPQAKAGNIDLVFKAPNVSSSTANLSSGTVPIIREQYTLEQPLLEKDENETPNMSEKNKREIKLLTLKKTSDFEPMVDETSIKIFNKDLSNSLAKNDPQMGDKESILCESEQISICQIKGEEVNLKLDLEETDKAITAETCGESNLSNFASDKCSKPEIIQSINSASEPIPKILNQKLNSFKDIVLSEYHADNCQLVNISSDEVEHDEVDTNISNVTNDEDILLKRDDNICKNQFQQDQVQLNDNMDTVTDKNNHSSSGFQKNSDTENSKQVINTSEKLPIELPCLINLQTERTDINLPKGFSNVLDSPRTEDSKTCKDLKKNVTYDSPNTTKDKTEVEMQPQNLNDENIANNNKLIQTDMQDNNNAIKSEEREKTKSRAINDYHKVCKTEIIVKADQTSFKEKITPELLNADKNAIASENLPEQHIMVEKSIEEIDCGDMFLEKNATLVYKDDSGVILKGIEYEDPEIGTCYVFPLVKSSDISGASDLLNDSFGSTIEVVEEVEIGTEIKSLADFEPTDDSLIDEDLFVKKPKITYSKHSLKRKLDMKDVTVSEKRPRRNSKTRESTEVKVVEKKYRKGKNIDYPKLSAMAISMSSYGKEFKRHMDYFNEVNLSYSITYSKEFIDVPKLLKNWPIKGPCISEIDKESEIEYTLFANTDEIENCFRDPLQLTLAEEITAEYNDENHSHEGNIEETNYNMGFGEGSGRVIQNLDGGAISKFSAATLSDVKQSQPFLLSESDDYFYQSSPQEQLETIKRFCTYIKLKEKVRTFFKNTTLELTSASQKGKDSIGDEEALSFPFELYVPKTIEPRPLEAIVQVVQVGQLPVSAAAQNPVTCDPRVTQVSDASPSQCSAENSPHDPQQEIKTEYTELTTAELNLPMMEQYVQHNQNISTDFQDGVSVSRENIPIQTEIKNEIDEIDELTEKTSEEKENSLENSEQRISNKHIGNVDYMYSNNNTNTNSVESEMQALLEPIKQEHSPTMSDQNAHNGSSEKMDQIAHAMNAAGITTASETVTNARTQAFVNLLSQKIRQSAVSSTPNSPNNFPKTTSINAVSLQQALAQILPPPLNQTNSADNNQQGQNVVTPQVLHIVQSKTSSGNQITLVDNSQQSVINAPNTTSVLHIVQNKGTAPAGATNGSPGPQNNTFSGISLVDAGLQQGGNQLLHIVNTGNPKNNNANQLLKRVNLLTNLANVQGSNEQKMVQFVCKSADGKSIQLNAPHQRSMVLRLQPIETPPVQPPTPKPVENQDQTPTQNATNLVPPKDTSCPQEIKSRSVYEENYAKFIQNSSSKPTLLEKSQSLPKFNQAFGKPVFQDGSQKQNEINSNLSSVNTAVESTECPQADNSVNLDHIRQLSSPPLLLRKPTVTTQAQTNLVQQIKQTIAPMNIQTMHGGVIYTRQIPVNIGGGQTINLITVPSTELVDESGQKQQINQEGIEPSIIKIVPQTATNTETNPESVNVNDENAQQPPTQPQPVLTQMRIKLPMLSKNPHMVSGTRVVRPSFFQIQRNIVGGANQQVYQQLVLTAAPPLGQQTIRLPHTHTRTIKVPESQSNSSESQMSSSTLEQLREFDMVLEQVKERSTVQPTNAINTFKLHSSSSDTIDSPVSVNTSSVAETTQVLYSIGGNQPLNVTYVSRKSSVNTPTTSTYVRSPDSSGIADSPTSSNHVQIPHTVTGETSSSETSSQPKPAKISSKSKSRPKSSSHSSNSLKLNSTVPPKTSAQKPLEDEQTTQRILYILAEYKEQVENSPDKDKPAPRRRTNPPTNPPGSSKRKKSSSGSRRSGRDISPVHGDETCRTIGSEDSSCGTSQGDCTESCLETHSPQDSPRKVARKLTFEQDTPTPTPPPVRPQPQRNVIVADGQTITVARGTAGKPATAVLMPANYILPVSMVKGGQQIAIVTNRGPKLLTVGGGEGGATNALLLQRLIGPAGLKPVLARPGVRHVRLPTTALHNLQAFNLATTTSIHPSDSTASSETTLPELIETNRNDSSPWTDRSDVKPDRASSPEESEPWHLPSSADPNDYSYEETVRAENMDRTVLDPIQDRYSPDMEAQRIFDKMFDVDTKKSYIVDSVDSPRCAYDIDASDCDDKPYQVVHKKDSSTRQGRFAHVSAAALRHKYAILEHELRLQKSLSEECEDLGVDSPSASELFPEAELLFAASPAQDHASHDTPQHSHTPQPTTHHLIHQSAIQPDIDDQIATDQLIQRETVVDDRQDLAHLGLEDVGIVTVSEDGMQATIALDQEEFARSHPNTTFHSEPTDDVEVQPFTLSGLKTRHITSTIFHSNRAPATVLMTAPQTTVISQATSDNTQHPVKYAEIGNMIHSIPSTHTNNINLSSVLVKDEGLTRYDNILTDSRELHLSNTASAIVHCAGNATQVIRRVCYEEPKRERENYLMDEPEGLIAGNDAKMVAEDNSRDATLMGGDVDDGNSSPERHTELFWESNSASERSDGRRPLDFSSDSEKCCKSPSYDETNSTDSSGVGTHMRLDSVIKDARGIDRSGSADGSSADDTHPPLRTYPPKRIFYAMEGDTERSLSGKTRAGERSPHSLEVRRRASGRGVVKRGCHCCNGSPAPPRPKKPRQKKPTMDFTH